LGFGVNFLKKISDEFLHLRLALSFFTILPVSPRRKIDEKEWARSVKYLWLVGLVYGLLNLIVLSIVETIIKRLEFSHIEGSFLTSLSLVLAHILLSGGLHLDALMDSFDGLAASKKNFHECRQVMKDSRSGAFGVMAACIYFLSKFVILFLLINHYSQEILILSLLLIPILSRSLLVSAIRQSLFSSGEDLNECKLKESSTWVFFENIKQPGDSVLNILAFFLILGIILSLVKIFNFNIINLFIIILLIIFFNQYLYKFLSKRLFGLSGDSLGAGLEITEVFSFLLMLTLGL
jgi:adenosylcobinamide-GDP ribazoletransferase